MKFGGLLYNNRKTTALIANRKAEVQSVSRVMSTRGRIPHTRYISNFHHRHSTTYNLHRVYQLNVLTSDASRNEA